MPRILSGFIFLFMMLLAFSSWARPCVTIKLVSLQGIVEARQAGQSTWQRAKLDEAFCLGDSIRTGSKARAALVIASDNTFVRLDQLTTLTLAPEAGDTGIFAELARGIAYFLTRTPRSLKVQTPFVNAAVRGTEFVVRADDSQSSVTVLEGSVLAANANGEVPLARGESAIATAGQSPKTRLDIAPRDAVAWALYYPPLFDTRILKLDTPWIEPLRRSAAAYLAGDIATAFEEIRAVPDSVTDPRFLNYRAGLLLSVGRLDEAQNDIQRSLAASNGNAHALALQSVIALARNNQDDGLQLARQASSADAQSTPALSALSYAQQAGFDINAARATIEAALQHDRDNVLVWARLSELWLALGDMPNALAAADRAVALNPNVARTQSVLGFVELTRSNAKAARTAFEKAITFDSADPLPRLGLGLALIRMGELEAGRREIETAVTLDPNNALIRSYLGKAYYEEKRGALAATQLEIAKSLDPNDPTPWFYDAIRKQSENRPVEALRDLQKSIALNDNRAVYRSRLLLDQDLAARSASLARIYRSLGFNQRALVEGWRSVNADPSNHSAHRFLADAYATLPRHNIARVSELLQAQLLQPLNLHPLQPQLTESGSFIPLELGPAATGYNEFNPLFTRDRVTAQLNTLVASNDTHGIEAVVSGLHGNVSYSVGAFDYHSDGFRANNQLDQRIYDAFAQVALTPALNVQAEVRKLERNNGDLSRRFNSNDFSLVRSEDLDASTQRLGLRYQFSPRSDLLFSFQKQSRDSRQSDTVNSTSVTATTRSTTATSTVSVSDVTNKLTELQHLYRDEKFNVVTGIGYFDGTAARRITGTNLTTVLPLCSLVPAFCPVRTTINVIDNTKTRHSSAYSYANFNQFENITWTVGLSLDKIRNSVIDERRINPKLGVTWHPGPETSLRVAAFRASKRDLVTDQTIEPTQVAGFNQYFDDLDGADTRRYGFGFDKQFGSFFAGLELTKRAVEIPVRRLSQTLWADRTERLDRAYIHWIVGTNWAGTLEYHHEVTERSRNHIFSDGIVELRTQRIPIALRYFDPHGLSWTLQGTHIRQTGLFADINQNPNIFSSGKDQGWLFDLELGFRLPRNSGFVSLGILNALDRTFRFQDTDPGNPTFIPGRTAYGRLSLTF